MRRRVLQTTDTAGNRASRAYALNVLDSLRVGSHLTEKANQMADPQVY